MADGLPFDDVLFFHYCISFCVFFFANKNDLYFYLPTTYVQLETIRSDALGDFGRNCGVRECTIYTLYIYYNGIDLLNGLPNLKTFV